MTSGPFHETEHDVPDIPDWVNPDDAQEPSFAHEDPVGAPVYEDPVRYPRDRVEAPGIPASEDPLAYPGDPEGYPGDLMGARGEAPGGRRAGNRVDPSPQPVDPLDPDGAWDDWEDPADGWDEYHSPWGRRVLIGLGLVIVGLILAAVLGVVWVNGHLNGSGGAAVNVSLPAGADHAVISQDLSRAGAISNEWLFKHYLDYRSYPPLDGGQYTVHHHEGYRAAMSDLGKGPKIVQIRLTIPEGYTLPEIAAAVGKLPGLSAQRFLQVAQSGAIRSQFEPPGSNNLEGFVFPDTYFIDPTETEQDILQTMVNRFDQVATSVGLANSKATTGLTPYQTLVVASLIEKEAKVEVDRGKISRVILNRLQAGMLLQIDATVEYAEGVHKTRLLDSDLRTPSPYNTYLHTGLPPGPIADPGQASLYAALNPTPGTWLYYVLSNPDGAHAFATTQDQFNQLVAQARAKGLL